MTALPQSVDLKPHVDRIIDQGALNSCTACAGCSALELMYSQLNVNVEFSRMFLYYYSRKESGKQGNVGVTPDSISQVLGKYGVCYETSWPYDGSQLDNVPTQSSVDEAINFKILGSTIITSDVLNNIKLQLSKGSPVLMAIPVYSGFKTLTGVWTTHTWDINTSASNPIIDRHEVLVIGYDDVSERLLVENSWGPNWGDGGFFGFPYSFINQISSQVTTLTIDPNSVAYTNKIPYVAPPPPKPLKNNNPYYFIGIIVLAIALGIIARFVN